MSGPVTRTLGKLTGIYPLKNEYNDAITKWSSLSKTMDDKLKKREDVADEIHELIGLAGILPVIIQRIKYLENKHPVPRSNDDQSKIDYAKKVQEEIIETIKRVPNYKNYYDPGKVFGGKKRKSRRRRRRAKITKRRKSRSKQKSKRRYLR
jgi:hypothetical protein